MKHCVYVIFGSSSSVLNKQNSILTILKKIFDPVLYDTISFQQSTQNIEEKLQKYHANISLLIVCGGDGSAVFLAKMSAQYSIPIMGINFGKLGFITTTEFEDFEQNLKLFLEKKLQIEDRTLGKVLIKEKKFETLFVNDVFAGKIHFKPVQMKISLGQYSTFHILGDGILISTPTGATGYGFSAGGPILSPNLHCFNVLPIANHGFFQKPIIIEDSATIQIQSLNLIRAGEDRGIGLHVDGFFIDHLSSEDIVTITNTEYTFKIVQPPNYSFYNSIIEKFKKVLNKVC